MTRAFTVFAAGVMSLALATSCSSDGEVVAGPGDEPIEAPADVVLTGQMLVLEDEHHGPQLCYTVAMSLPPQCGGPDLIGFSWDDVDGEESRNRTTWGAYRVTGTWAHETLTLTEPPRVESEDAPTGDVGAPQLSTPCPEFSAGQFASSPPLDVAWPGDDAEYAGHWFDQATGVMTVAFTDRVDEHRAELAASHPGVPICVVGAEHSMAELSAARDRVMSADFPAAGVGLIGGNADPVRGLVEFDTYVDDAEVRAWIDERVGDVPYKVRAAMRPVG